jgi:hypothetical protein
MRSGSRPLTVEVVAAGVVGVAVAVKAAARDRGNRRRAKGRVRGSLRHRDKVNLRGSLRRRDKVSLKGNLRRRAKVSLKGSLRRKAKVSLKARVNLMDKPHRKGNRPRRRRPANKTVRHPTPRARPGK